MIDQILQKLIDFLQSASPVVWKALIKQVYAEAIENAIWLVVFIVAVAVGLKLASYVRSLKTAAIEKYKKNHDYGDAETSDYNMMMGLCYGGVVAFTMMGIISLQSVVMHLFNPEYYAIQKIISMIAGK